MAGLFMKSALSKQIACLYGAVDDKSATLKNVYPKDNVLFKVF